MRAENSIFSFSSRMVFGTPVEPEVWVSTYKPLFLQAEINFSTFSISDESLVKYMTLNEFNFLERYLKLMFYNRVSEQINEDSACIEINANFKSAKQK